jgi:TolB-like protein
LRSGHPVVLPAKELELLRYLLSQAGRIVSTEELQKAGWGKVHVSCDSLPRAISSLRAHLQMPGAIQTVYKQGYRFHAGVEVVPDEAAWEKPAVGGCTLLESLPRLAILPFAVEQGVPEPFGSGLAEETMLHLGQSRFPVVQILARDSVFCLSGKGLSAAAVARRLGAELALTGFVTASASQFRVRVEMIRSSDDVQLWCEDFLMPRADFSESSSRVARCVESRLGGRPGVEEAIREVIPGNIFHLTAAAEIPAENGALLDRSFSAYSLFMKARQQWNTFERHGMQDALQGFRQATELDSTLVSARAHLVHGYLRQARFGYLRPDLAADGARQQARQLRELGGEDETVRMAMRWVRLFHDRDLKAAKELVGEGERGPYHPLTTRYRSKIEAACGAVSEMIKTLGIALKADPYSAGLRGRLAWANYLAGDAESAVREAEAAVSQQAEHQGALLFSAMVLAALGRPGEKRCARAVELARTLVRIAPYFDAGQATLAYALARNGSVAEARAILERQQWLSQERFVMRSFHAPVLLALGDGQGAMLELSLSEQRRCPWFMEMMRDPRMEPLHGHAEFQRLQLILAGLGSAA